MDSLFEEVAYLSYYFHWPYEQVMRMEHHERQAWVNELSKINRALNEAGGERSMQSWPQ